MENEIEIIYDLVFAYENKDNDLPHDFELKALHKAYSFVTCQLGKEDKISKFILNVFEDQIKKFDASYNKKDY